MMEEIYVKNPALRPSRRQREAAALRKPADEIEVADIHLKRIKYLQKILHVIIGKVSGIGKIGEWRKAGFDNKQIGDYLAPKIREWTEAGFSDKDINDYLGIGKK